MDSRYADIIVLSQNIKLSSLKPLSETFGNEDKVVFITTQHLFEYEREYLQSIFHRVEFHSFANLLTDDEMERCDIEAYQVQCNSTAQYYSKIKELKNEAIVNKVDLIFRTNKKIIASNDLGIDATVWLNHGYESFLGDYYYSKPEQTEKVHGLVYSYLDMFYTWMKLPIFKAKCNGTKYLLYGEMHRVGYRIDVVFQKRSKVENLFFILDYCFFSILKKSLCSHNTIHLSSLHESIRWTFPRDPNYQVKIIQDGYLPPNYSSRYLQFVAPNVSYYAWDKLGEAVFVNQGISVSLLPIRKKLYMPEPIFPENVKNVLIVASGAGDWTAIKNRSDDDQLIEAIISMAELCPEINFTLRCHPTWTHPDHQGVNAVNRVAGCFVKSNLPNVHLSGNIPILDCTDHFQFSYTRSSLEKDLEGVDIVFGEHSVSMIDAAFKKIPFASLNVTGRRDFFCGMTDLGFPHFETINDAVGFIRLLSKSHTQSAYLEAIKRYNFMTDEE